MSPERYAEYKDYLNVLRQAGTANASAYDSALLTFSAGALALSLTFTKDLVPFAKAIWLPALFLAWLLFVLTIVGVVATYIYSQCASRWLERGAYAYYLRGAFSLNAMSARIDTRLHRANIMTGVTFVLGFVALTTYVTANVYWEAEVSKKSHPPKELTKSIPLPTYSKPQPPAPKEPPRSPPPPQPAKK